MRTTWSVRSRRACSSASGIGVALLGRPELILLDEPTSALDPVGRQDVRRIIRELRDRGVAVFLNSHLLAEIERVCDRVAIVDRGRVVASGTIDELLAVRAVRMRATGLGPTELARLSAFGHLEQDGEWLTAAGVAPDEVPDLVDAVVAVGGRIYAVEQQRETLEERFFDLVARDAAARRARPDGTGAGQRPTLPDRSPARETPRP